MSDMRVCNTYWSKVTDLIMANPSQQKFHMLAKHCHRYMHFNNNLNGTYKNVQFEKAIVNLLIKDLDEGISALIPYRFSKAASFIMAYGHTSDKYAFPENIVQRIEAMQEQFSVIDCLQLTRGIQVALQMRWIYRKPRFLYHKTTKFGACYRFNRGRTPELIQQMVRLENVFNACTERHLDDPNLTLGKLNSIIRSYSNRKCKSRKFSLYQPSILTAIFLLFYFFFSGNKDINLPENYPQIWDDSPWITKFAHYSRHYVQFKYGQI